MPYFQSNEDTLYYETVGEGPALFFISPPGMGGGTFYQQQEGLKDQFQVITFDPSGNGKSTDSNKDNYTIKEWAEDVLALADHLNLEKIIPCGYSMGGMAAQEFAISYPERTAGLILISSFSEVSTLLLSLKVKTGISIARNDFLNQLAMGLSVSHTRNKKNRRNIKKSIKATNSADLKKMYKEGHYYNCTSRLSSIKCPVASVLGKYDLLIYPYQKLFQEHISNLHSIKISNVAHQIPTRAANELNSIIRSFNSQYNFS